MNKQELLKKVQEETGCSKADVTAVIASLESNILKALKDGDSIKPWELGTFKAVDVAARTARNPRTGEEVEVPAARKLKFQPSSTFKKL